MQLRTLGRLAAACAGIAVLGAAHTAAAGPRPVAQVTLEECLSSSVGELGGEAWHVEFESRAGVPIYEFILHTANDDYYVGCNATTGRIAEVDVIVSGDDARWQSVAKIDEETAVRTATERYKGEVEETKRLLLSAGGPVYEVDVEVPDADGEFNVYVDAVTGGISQVNHEYWEIGRPAAMDDDDD